MGLIQFLLLLIIVWTDSTSSVSLSLGFKDDNLSIKSFFHIKYYFKLSRSSARVCKLKVFSVANSALTREVF